MNECESRKTIKKRDWISIFFRSFLIQASWSFERMQSLGFAYAMLPALRRLYPGREEFRARLSLHMEYFNTQPYLASFILGAAVRLEEERAAGGEVTKSEVSELKTTLMAPLGALGDSFFWGALKPMSVLIAVTVLLTGFWWAPILFLVLYNSWHLWLRAGVLRLGYRSSGDVMQLMARYRFTRWAGLFKAVAIAVLGGMVGMLPVWRQEYKPDLFANGTASAGAALLITLVLSSLLRRGGSPIKLMLGIAAVCTALAYAGAV